MFYPPWSSRSQVGRILVLLESCRVWGLCDFVAQPLWRLNVPQYLPWLELNGLFVFAPQKTTRLNPAWLLLAGLPYLVCWGQSLIQVCLRAKKVLLLTVFHSKIYLKLKSRLWYDLLHSALQPTSPADNKDLLSSITFFAIVSKSHSLQCIFTACIYYVCAIPLRSDIAHPFRKSPTLTLWKSLKIELSQQFPASLSWQNVFIAVQGSSVPMDLCVTQKVDRRACEHTHTHTHTARRCTATNTCSGEKQGPQLWAAVTGSGCRGVTVPAGRPQHTQCTASRSTDRDRSAATPRRGKQSYDGKRWQCFLSWCYNQIIFNCAVLSLPLTVFIEETNWVTILVMGRGHQCLFNSTQYRHFLIRSAF